MGRGIYFVLWVIAFIILVILMVGVYAVLRREAWKAEIKERFIKKKRRKGKKS